MNWLEVTDYEKLKSKGRVLFRHGPAQIAVFMVDETVYAIDNRCPHEGYPLMQGEIDKERCTLTCHWHNWKFDLKLGDALIGQDAVRTYPVKLDDGKVLVDLSPVDPQILLADRLKALHEAFQQRQYGRASRELVRMHYQGLDPRDALREAINWSHSRLEFGTTHAHAAMADWLTLADEAESPQQKLIPLLESFDHLALDVLGSAEFPYSESVLDYQPEALLAAIEAENENEAIALLNGARQSGIGFAELLPAFTQAALAHHLDFGHSMIYVQKTAELIEKLGPSVEQPLMESLIRTIIYATREELLPEFKGYDQSLKQLQDIGFGQKAQAPDLEPLFGCGVKKSFAWVLAQAAEHKPEAIFATLLQALARHLLFFEDSHQWASEVPVANNIGWLDVTHGLTFANSVHELCARFPELWPQGLLQMALFYGRNTAYVDYGQILEVEIPADNDTFWAMVKAHLYDHGLGQPIFAAHHLKTALAVRAETRQLPDSDRQIMYQGLWRFLKAPLKQKHVWRTMYQSLELISKDFQTANQA